MRIMTLPMGTLPSRPASVPSDAHWIEESREWEHGPTRAGEKRSGVYRWWRVDGSLACEAHYENDLLNGPLVRRHPNGMLSEEAHYLQDKLHGVRIWHRSLEESDEPPIVPNIADSVFRCETDCDMGEVVAMRFFNREGKRVCVNGSRFPTPPSHLPETVMFLPTEALFVEARYDEDTKPTGVWRMWTPDGVLHSDRDHSKVPAHERIFHRNGQVKAEGQVDPERTGIWRSYDEDGALVTEEVWENGTKLSATLPEKSEKPKKATKTKSKEKAAKPKRKTAKSR